MGYRSSHNIVEITEYKSDLISKNLQTKYYGAVFQAHRSVLLTFLSHFLAYCETSIGFLRVLYNVQTIVRPTNHVN
jgi:hypothetical protein